RYEYDSRGQRAKIVDPLRGEVRFTYDNQKNLTTLTDERGNTTTFVYDELYRQIAQRDPLGFTTTSAYDPVGNLTEKVDRLGRRITTTYDALNRPVTITYVDATVGYTYDEAGRQIRINDTQSGSIEWTYDDANRTLSEKTPQGLISYAYNKANQRASMTAADRPQVRYEYDTAGRQQNIIQGAGTFTWSYDDLSRMKSLQRPNGVTTTYSYDAANKLNRLTHANASSGVFEDLQYSYNTDDEIEAITSLASGTLLPVAAAASAADTTNRIARFGQAGYTFDEEGQTRTKTDSQGTTAYEWDARGRMTKVALPNGLTVTHTYDTLGRRAIRTANNLTTTFLSDGQDVVLDRGSGGVVTDYLNGPGIDNKLLQASPATGALYFLQDHLGSTIALAGAGGGIVERQSYEVFGAGAGSSLTRYTYTGREWDAEIGLYYYRARYYDPKTGRFISEDPIGFQGMNFYVYGSNNTDFFENWNHYYDPVAGRYLKPEPMFQKPEGARMVAQRGLSTPKYLYVLNNPIKFFDPNGLNIPVDEQWLEDILRDWCSNYVPDSLEVHVHKTAPRAAMAVDYISGKRADCEGWNSESLGVSSDDFINAQMKVCNGITFKIVMH
ncbi:MAG TPA: RHS repeat-associated core domain-containing protein, partial [Pyrinomonadaceae bacterium]|nr:RHS repeat-associated core domain-containing protein [Pyrinomonadaceae bacterium]